MKILCNRFLLLLFFIFVLPVLPCKPKTWYRKSCNLFLFLVTSSTNMKNGMKSSFVTYYSLLASLGRNWGYGACCSAQTTNKPTILVKQKTGTRILLSWYILSIRYYWPYFQAQSQSDDASSRPINPSKLQNRLQSFKLRILKKENAYILW